MEVVLYVRKRSLRCWRAKGLLARKGYYVKVIHTTNEELGELLSPYPETSILEKMSWAQAR
jgi:hypothetical protein